MLVNREIPQSLLRNEEQQLAPHKLNWTQVLNICKPMVTASTSQKLQFVNHATYSSLYLQPINRPTKYVALDCAHDQLILGDTGSTCPRQFMLWMIR